MASQSHKLARDSELVRLQRLRSEVLERRADVQELLARTDERVPPSCIPEEWHIRLTMPNRPDFLDDYGGRFLWTPTDEVDGTDNSVASADAAEAATKVAGAGGSLTVFPLAEPYGALDIASMLGQLRAHVRETGGHVPTAYPSGALLRRARASLVDLSTQLGAFAHGLSADPKGVRARLDELHATIDRAEVAIAVESAGRSDDF